MDHNILIETLENLADVICLNPQHYLSRSRMLHMAEMLRKGSLIQEADAIRHAANGSVDEMVDALRNVANGLD